MDDLQNELGIRSANHPDLPLVILNYNQIESPKIHPIVREARGLVLNKNDWSLVARSFPRFFNWGEVPEEMELFDFSSFYSTSKEDGSLAIIYNFKGSWHANTRGSFALDQIQYQNFSWRKAMCIAMGIHDLKDLDSKLDPSLTYICEFVSPWNKIVRKYEKPQMFLLTAFCGSNELNLKDLNSIESCFFQKPERYNFASIGDIKSFLTDKEKDDPTFEGVIICDKNHQRWKIKNPSYLSLHRIKGEGDNLFHPRHLLPFILKNEQDELLTYFPEVKDQYYSFKQQVESFFEEIKNIWSQTKEIQSQKEFALAIKDKTAFTSILFQIRKKYGPEPTAADLRKEFVGAEPLILKRLLQS